LIKTETNTLFERSGVMEKKTPTPKPPSSTIHQSENIALDEIACYKDGETIEIDASDTRIYCIVSGSVQRAVTQPGCNGLGTLLLAKIEPRQDGGYWNPRRAHLNALSVGINVVFKAVGETKIQKIPQGNLPKDPGRLTKIFLSSLVEQGKQIAVTELVIQREYKRAEDETGKARSANGLAESLRQELEEAQKPTSITPDKMRLMCEVGQLRQNLETAHTREQNLRDELRKLRSQIKAQETRLQLNAIDVRELKDLRTQLSEQSRWIEQNRPDLPAVQAIQGIANNQQLNDELDDLFAEAFKPVAVDEADGDCAVVNDDELMPVGGDQLIELGPADDQATDGDNLRATLPYRPKVGDKQSEDVVIPASSRLPIVLAPVGQVLPQVTQAHDMREIREQAAKDDAEADGKGEVRPFHDSLNDDSLWPPDKKKG